MVQFNLPQNSKIEVGEYFKDRTNSKSIKKVNVYRWDPSTGKNPRVDTFEVDMENVVHGKANLFTYMHNMSDKPRTLVLRVQSPDFRPHDISMTYLLNPGESNWWPDAAVPLADSGNDDILAIMSGLLRDGTVAWQSLLPERFGEATVSVRLEEVSGELLVGSQMNVRVRSEFKEKIRTYSSIILNVIGIAGIIISSSVLTYQIVYNSFFIINIC